MQPTQELLNRLVAAQGADTTTFSPPLAIDLWLHPIKEPFTPGPALTLLDTDLADFAGSAAKTTPDAVRALEFDPLSGELVLNIPEPIGGWRWVTTSGLNLPQTIYGVALSDDSATVEGPQLLAAAVFDTPITLTTASMAVEWPSVNFRYLQSSPY